MGWREDFAWAAGLFEGEGTITSTEPDLFCASV
jgi:hypothetical protein